MWISFIIRAIDLWTAPFHSSLDSEDKPKVFFLPWRTQVLLLNAILNRTSVNDTDLTQTYKALQTSKEISIYDLQMWHEGMPIGDAKTEACSASLVCWTMPIVSQTQFNQKEFQIKLRWESKPSSQSLHSESLGIRHLVFCLGMVIAGMETEQNLKIHSQTVTLKKKKTTNSLFKQHLKVECKFYLNNISCRCTCSSHT